MPLIQVFLLILLAWAAPSEATPLSTAASACAVHTFCQVNMPGLTTALLDSTGGQTITSFSSKASWNPNTRTFYFLGQGHLTNPKFISYADASDTWSSLSVPFAGGGFYHAYEHNTVNPLLNKVYVRHYGASYMDKYDVATSSWSQTASQAEVGVQCCGAAEWFPDMGVVVHFGDENGSFGGLWGYNEGTNSWSRIGAANTYTTGNYDQSAAYSPVYHVIVFGGGNGNTNLWKLNASGTVTAVTAAPIGIDAATPGGTIFTVDPVSGNFLLISATGVVRELSFASNSAGTWTTISGVTVPFVNASPGNGVYGVVATPISNYGVTGFLVCGGVTGCSGNASPSFYIYKHTAGGGGGGSALPPPAGDTSAPTTPGNLSASAVSASQINLSWTASTDNVGVTGYKVFRNGTQSGTLIGTTYQDTGLSASTTYVYTVQAYDAAGNTSSQSTGASATTQAAPSAGGTDFQSKCQASGVINCFGVDSTNLLYYTWPTGTVCDSALGSLLNGNNPFGLSRSGNGNVVAHVENGKCVFPEIDTSVKHSGAGALKFTIGTHTGSDSSGYYTEPFKRLGGGAFSYVGPGSPLGSVLYFQFYQRFDPNFVSTNYLCTGGDCGGWKQMIWYGNPPNGSSSGLLEVTHNNGWQRGVPQMYGQQGHDDYGIQDVANCPYAGSGYTSRPNYPEPPCVRFKANQWMEFTGRIEFRGSSNSPTSRVQLWVDGKLVIDYGQAKICWTCGEGEGIGSFLASPYHTNKDSSQDHPTGFTWMDDIIVSTQPIAMTNSSVPNPPPAAPTNLRVQ